MKKCSCCEEEKVISCFYKNKHTKDGRCRWCKQCEKDYWRRYLRYVKRDWLHDHYLNDHYKVKTLGEIPPWQQRKNFKQLAAYRVYNKALKTGRLIKPDKCEMADETCSCSIEGHHDTYSKPLDVRWLCSSHHKRLHIWIKKLIEEDFFDF